jgi:hypothetical protein
MNVDDAAVRAALHHATESVVPPADGPARILRLASEDPTAGGSSDTTGRPPDAHRWQRSAIAIGVAAAIVGGIAFVPRALDSGSGSGQDAATARDDASGATRAPTVSETAADAGGLTGSQGDHTDQTVPAAASTTAAQSLPDASTDGAAEAAGRDVTANVSRSHALVEVGATDTRELQQRLLSEPEAKLTAFAATSPTGSQEWSIRVPVERLDATLALLRADGGDVRTTVTRTNVSALYAQLVTQRHSYQTAATALERAADAETDTSAAEVARNEASRIRTRLAQVERLLLVLVDQIRYATITVRVSPGSSSSAPRRRRSPRAASPRSRSAATRRPVRAEPS